MFWRSATRFTQASLHASACPMGSTAVGVGLAMGVGSAVAAHVKLELLSSNAPLSPLGPFPASTIGAHRTVASLLQAPAIAAAVAAAASSTAGEETLLAELGKGRNTFYFLASDRKIVVACNWVRVMRRVAQALPDEGVLGQGFLRHVRMQVERMRSVDKLVLHAAATNQNQGNATPTTAGSSSSDVGSAESSSNGSGSSSSSSSSSSSTGASAGGTTAAAAAAASSFAFVGPGNLPPGMTVDRWVAENFSDCIAVAPSETDPSLFIYRPLDVVEEAADGEGLLDGGDGTTTTTTTTAATRETLARIRDVARALAYVGSDASPVFTPLAYLQPILTGPISSQQQRTWNADDWIRLIGTNKPQLGAAGSTPKTAVDDPSTLFRQAFDVQVDVRVSPKASCETASLFVDGSSASAADVDAAVTRLLVDLQLHFIVTHRSVFRYATDPAHGVAARQGGNTSAASLQDAGGGATGGRAYASLEATDVVVSPALEVTYELAAAVLHDTNARAAAAPSATIASPSSPSAAASTAATAGGGGVGTRLVLVVCGEQRLEELKDVLLETCFVGAGVRVVVATPLQAVQIR